MDAKFGRIELSFERNDGQFDSRVKFLSRHPGYNLALTGDEAVMQFTTPKSSSSIRMKFLGHRRNMKVEGVERMATSTNYLRGGSRQKTNVPSFKRVLYSDVYRGIDVEYHGDGRLLEYDFIVKPGANPDAIRIGFSGVRYKSIDSSGDLILNADGPPLVQRKPRVYQNIDGQEKIVEAAYVLTQGHVSFKVGAYDKTRPLVIDPVLLYSTFFGGSGSEIAYGLAVDGQGAMYVAGVTNSGDFPLAAGVQGTYGGGTSDAFVFKLDPTGTQLVYSTFIGGIGADEAHAIAVDAGGSAYITGYTQSNNFPIVNGFQKGRGGGQDAYFLKLNASGTAIDYSTFLGGSQDDRGFALALDAGNNAYITGTTGSANFPLLNPFQSSNAGGFADAFVTKIGPAGNIIYSTFVGGVGNDNPLGIAVDGNGAAYVTGWTTSVNFPLANPFQARFGGTVTPIGPDDVFVFKLNPAGRALEYSTYVGGTASDEGTRIAVDSAGSAYVTGFSSSVNFPVQRPYQATLNGLTSTDAFVLKLAPDGASLVYSTYFGGFQQESGSGIAVDSAGAVYITGFTTSFDLPTANQIQASLGGDRDAFVAKFDPGGNVLVFSTFLGASAADGGVSLALDASRNIYVAGFTNSPDFPIAGAFQPGYNPGQDAFVSKLNAEDIVSASVFRLAPQGTSSVITKGTRSDAVFGYATADASVPNTQLTGLAIIDRHQNGALVSEDAITTPPFIGVGRLFVNVSSNGRSVLSIANPNDTDVTVDFFFTDAAGTTGRFATTTVSAHQHFSRFVTDVPLNITVPGTLNFTASLPIAATAFFTVTNESNELLLSDTPIVDPIGYPTQVGNKTVTIPELADGAGWTTSVILVNPGEDPMHGEVRFFSQGNGSQPGAPMEVGIGDGSTSAAALEFAIPPRSFEAFATAGNATISETPFAMNVGSAVTTPGGGALQITGWASADLANPNGRLNGLQLLQYRQLGITQSETGVIAPSPRTSGTFFAEASDKIRSFIAIANPNAVDVSLTIFLTDDVGTSTDPVTITVGANGQYSSFLTDAPISLPTGNGRAINFTASLPVMVTALRFLTNERSNSVISSIPIADSMTSGSTIGVIPHFTDGVGWKTQVILVNNSDQPMGGEIRFMDQGSAGGPAQPVIVSTDNGDASVFQYAIAPRSFFRVKTNGSLGAVSVGSVRIVPFPGNNTPAAHAILSHFVIDDAASAASGTTVGYTILETSLEGQPPRASLRLYAEGTGDFNNAKATSTRTAITIANPSDAPSTIQLQLTSFSGAQLALSSPIQVPASGQVSRYLPEFPGFEAIAVPFQGIVRLTVLAGPGVMAGGFRVMFNERGDYLFTTTGPLNEDAGTAGRLIFPYVTDSTGYTTEFILINPPDVTSAAGVLHYLAADGSPLGIDAMKLGSVQIVPFSDSSTPHAHALLARKVNGVTTFITEMEAQLPQMALRVYAEAIGDFDFGTAGATNSAIALANPAAVPVTVQLEMRGLDGNLIRTSSPVQVPASGQVAMMFDQIPGFETLAAPIQGVLRVVSTSPGVTAAGFRAIYNERGNPLFTTTGPLTENAGTATQLVYPHIAEGGGYTTQFIVIGGATGQANSGTLSFFNQEGNPLNVTLSVR